MQQRIMPIIRDLHFVIRQCNIIIMDCLNKNEPETVEISSDFIIHFLLCRGNHFNYLFLIYLRIIFISHTLYIHIFLFCGYLIRSMFLMMISSFSLFIFCGLSVRVGLFFLIIFLCVLPFFFCLCSDLFCLCALLDQHI